MQGHTGSGFAKLPRDFSADATAGSGHQNGIPGKIDLHEYRVS
jgi:hypothetical protein